MDYWPLARPILDVKEKSLGKGQDPTGKNSIKSTFRHLQVRTNIVVIVPIKVQGGRERSFITFITYSKI